MLADRSLHAALIGLVLCGGEFVLAEEEEVPDSEFLEYLGMWEESDEVWLILDEAMTTVDEERSDPVPDGEESTEKDDES